MADLLKVACIQMNSGPEIEPNLLDAESFIRAAASQGAKLIATPENTCLMRTPSTEKIKIAKTQDEHPGVSFFKSLASNIEAWLLIGSMGIKVSDDKIANRSFLFSPQGKIAATYDKIHLFDVDLPTGEVHRESNVVAAGKHAVVADMDGAKLGMSICYDLRFSHLYRDLAKAGAQILSIPAAFTVPTGRAHWETLLRARAIETGSFVIAPAQTGTHDGGRMTWGHSAIIGPWGDVIAKADDEPGLIMADLNLGDVAKARAAIPALKHDRDYSF